LSTKIRLFNVIRFGFAVLFYGFYKVCSLATVAPNETLAVSGSFSAFSLNLFIQFLNGN